MMEDKYYYEKRIINDVSGNTYPVWYVYQLDTMNRPVEFCTLHSVREFINLRKIYTISYRQLTSRGIM